MIKYAGIWIVLARNLRAIQDDENWKQLHYPVCYIWTLPGRRGLPIGHGHIERPVKRVFVGPHRERNIYRSGSRGIVLGHQIVPSSSGRSLTHFKTPRGLQACPGQKKAAGAARSLAFPQKCWWLAYECVGKTDVGSDPRRLKSMCKRQLVTSSCWQCDLNVCSHKAHLMPNMQRISRSL